MAGDTLLDALGKQHLTFTEAPSERRTDFTGDLDEMLYPLALTPEEEIYYMGLDRFSYVGEVESTFDPRITTVNPSAEGSLVMYRDSFGNALLPFLANSYADAYFSRGIPYQMTDLAEHQADTVIVERAERFLPDMAEKSAADGSISDAAGGYCSGNHGRGFRCPGGTAGSLCEGVGSDRRSFSEGGFQDLHPGKRRGI